VSVWQTNQRSCRGLRPAYRIGGSLEERVSTEKRGPSWRDSFSGHGKPALSPEQAEIAKLRKQLREAEIERDILKKAVSIFSRNDSSTAAANLSIARRTVHKRVPTYVCCARRPVEKMCRVFKVSRSRRGPVGTTIGSTKSHLPEK
jgi:hypothetical protein